MQDVGDEEGDERHIVVDGQQRVRAVLDFVQGTYSLEGEEVTKKWRGLSFEELSADEKKAVFGYKFVVRILPPMEEEGIRKIFARLNRNVVALNEQELRNATYWGPFIKTIQYMADEDPFWAESGLFSANDHRRMLNHEYQVNWQSHICMDRKIKRIGLIITINCMKKDLRTASA